MMRDLIGRINKLLALRRSKWTNAIAYLREVCAVQQGVLDELTRRDLSRTLIYSDIKKVIFSPTCLGGDLLPRKQLKMVRAHCAPGLRVVKTRLELARQLKPKGTAKRSHYRRKSAEDIEREQRIAAVIRKGKRGMAYCRLLDNEGIKPPQEWIDEGCPCRYVEAYSDGKWKHRIQDEKFRIQRRYHIATRRTRH